MNKYQINIKSSFTTILLIVVSIITLNNTAFSQTNDSNYINLNYLNPNKYQIGKITVSGSQYMDKNVIVLISGLSTGQIISVPGEELRKALEILWKQELFSDVKIYCTSLKENIIDLEIYLKERPRLSKYSIRGLRKSETKNVKDEIGFESDQIITDNLINKTSNQVKNYFYKKGFFNTKVFITTEDDKQKTGRKIMRIYVDKGKRVKLYNINVIGNEKVSDRKLISVIKKPKPKKNKINIFASSKFIEETYEEEKQKIISKYANLGYRDAMIIGDSIYKIKPNLLNIDIYVKEGKRYYFRNITYNGNTKYTDVELSKLLGIKKGEIYNQSKLDSRLNMSADGYDISSLYMDDGYLFFNINPVETNVENDSIDLEIRIYEGKQATINKVIVSGNDKTSDHVILRQLRTVPGDKFSRANIQRSIRELAQLNYFDPEKLGVNPIPNPQNGTVDIEYKVVEKPSDQIEASGGWGGMGGFIGTVGLSLNNFSTKRMFKKGAWDPIPAGDGQKVSLRVQSNGLGYRTYNFSFNEPWLGGKKPNSFSFTIFHSLQTNLYIGGFTKKDEQYQYLRTTGVMLSLGKYLKWPDDYFTISNSINYQRYNFKDKGYFGFGGETGLGYSKGYSNNINLQTTLSRNSTDQPIFPMGGSSFTLTTQFTPPYSLINGKDYSKISMEDKFRWLEYYKWKIEATWFHKVVGKLVLATSFKFGFLNYYNKNVGYSPFERFKLGGTGLVGWNLYGSEVIAMRGYDQFTKGSGAVNYDKYTIELRYPISLNPSATVYIHTFIEGGNAFYSLKDYNPFKIYRTAGTGVRFFLPMFGLLGLDCGWKFDNAPFNETISQKKFLFQFFLGPQF
ncbi:MAG: outer membrane protein assembly factor BamA [Bacteroidia bacterium]|nr:outer membrane protein assembly factor BamA [Bacteroidia bacterium]